MDNMPSRIDSPVSQSITNFKVAIIGGGIGGLTAALSLSTLVSSLKDITVYEQAPAYREIGAGIGIGVNAGRILRELGVYEKAIAISGERSGVHRSLRRWDNGVEIVSVGAMDEANGDRPGVRQLSVHRAEFLDVLCDEIRLRKCAKLETNKRVMRVEVRLVFQNEEPDLTIMSQEQDSDTVLITFADNSTATANLVVACDGIHSSVRSQFAVDKPRYSGRVAYRGLLPLSSISSSWPYSSYAVSWLAPDKHFLVFPISQNRTMNVVAFVTRPESELGDLEESWTSHAPKEQLAKEYEGWEESVQRIIQHMKPTVSKWKLNDRDPLSQWSYLDGKVLLMGDAAHAMLPHQGSGAGHAIEDAYILGLAMRDYIDNPSSSLSTYTSLCQAVRLPRAQKAQITSRQAGDIYEMQGLDFKGLTFEECLPIVHDKMKGRMRWVWGHDLSAEYEDMKAQLGHKSRA